MPVTNLSLLPKQKARLDKLKSRTGVNFDKLKPIIFEHGLNFLEANIEKLSLTDLMTIKSFTISLQCYIFHFQVRFLQPLVLVRFRLGTKPCQKQTM